MNSELEKSRKNFTSASLLLFLAILVSFATALLMVKFTGDKRLHESAILILTGIQVVFVGLPSVGCVGLATSKTSKKISRWTELYRLTSRTITPLIFMASLAIWVTAQLYGLTFILNPEGPVRALLAVLPLLGAFNWAVFSLYLWGLSNNYGKPSASINITLLLWISSVLAIATGSAQLAWGGVQNSDTGATILLTGYALSSAGLVGTMFSLARLAKIVKERQTEVD